MCSLANKLYPWRKTLGDISFTLVSVQMWCITLSWWCAIMSWTQKVWAQALSFNTQQSSWDSEMKPLYWCICCQFASEWVQEDNQMQSLWDNMVINWENLQFKTLPSSSDVIIAGWWFNCKLTGTKQSCFYIGIHILIYIQFATSWVKYPKHVTDELQSLVQTESDCDANMPAFIN